MDKNLRHLDTNAPGLILDDKKKGSQNALLDQISSVNVIRDTIVGSDVRWIFKGCSLFSFLSFWPECVAGAITYQATPHGIDLSHSAVVRLTRVHRNKSHFLQTGYLIYAGWVFIQIFTSLSEVKSTITTGVCVCVCEMGNMEIKNENPAPNLLSSATGRYGTPFSYFLLAGYMKMV